MQVRLRFGFGTGDRLRRSCVSKARNAGEIMFFERLDCCARQWLILIGFVVLHAGKI